MGNIFNVPKLPVYYVPNSTTENKIKIYNIDKILCRLPKNLKYLDLTFSYKLNLLSEYVSYKIIDKNIHVKKELVMKSQPLDNLPEGLQVLKFPANYNLIQIDKIPQNIIKLWFSNKFNQSVDKLLNPNFCTNRPKPKTKLTHLIFGSDFNKLVNHLPDSVKYLYFGDSFNKSVDNLPNSLLFIKFGCDFNYSINNLPISLINIEFGTKFSQSLNNLNHGIVSIKFPNLLLYNELNNTMGYNVTINKLPSSIKNIYFSKTATIYNHNYDYIYNNHCYLGGIKSNYNIDPVFDNYKHLIEFY
jgi:hypothetical protein